MRCRIAGSPRFWYQQRSAENIVRGDTQCDVHTYLTVAWKEGTTDSVTALHSPDACRRLHIPDLQKTCPQVKINTRGYE